MIYAFRDGVVRRLVNSVVFSLEVGERRKRKGGFFFSLVSYLRYWVTPDRGGHEDVDKVAPRLGQDVVVGGEESNGALGEDQVGFF